jgi:hypothetical protein
MLIRDISVVNLRMMWAIFKARKANTAPLFSHLKLFHLQHCKKTFSACSPTALCYISCAAAKIVGISTGETFELAG